MNKTQKQKTYWFILDNYVHLSVKGDAVMFYNPLTGEILEYKGSDTVLKLVKRLQSPKNLLVIPLTENELLHPEISQFMSKIRASFMGDLIEASLTKIKPIQLMPYVKVHKDAEIIKKSPSRSVGEYMMKYLVEVSLYVNSDCNLNCDICGTAYKQFLCCTRAKSGKNDLDIQSIRELFRQLQGAPLDRVNILGGDIFKFPDLEELVTILGESSFNKVLYIHYLNLLHQEDKLSFFPEESFSFNIPVTFPVEDNQWKGAVEILQNHHIKGEFLFIVSNETEVTWAEELISQSCPENYSLHPVFNGNNLEFFERNIYFDREDLKEAKPTDKEIQSRQIVNPFHFGRLIVLSDGHIYANVNTARLGTLEITGIHEAVYQEMYRGRSWRRIRKRVKPCNTCNFAALCPPLSNYEYALKKNNLCHIRNEK